MSKDKNKTALEALTNMAAEIRTDPHDITKWFDTYRDTIMRALSEPVGDAGDGSYERPFNSIDDALESMGLPRGQTSIDDRRDQKQPVDVEELKKECEEAISTYQEGDEVGSVSRAAIDHLHQQGHLSTPDKWQPIETAPRDGTLILIYDGDEIHTASWDQKASRIKKKEWLSNGCIDIWMTFNPTHWQPLPTPPTKGQPDGMDK